MIKSLFPQEMMNTSELDLESIAGKLLTFAEQFHLVHWQTGSYAEHIATGELYEYLYTFRDEVIEKLMGYTGRKPNGFKMGNINTSSETAISELMSFAISLKRYAESNGFIDVAAMADTLSGKAAKYKYLLRLA